MSVVIDEVIAETREAPAPAPAARAPAGAAPQPADLDRFDLQLARRRHRLERLWAD
jgi:ribosomal protein L12E/L44/L45/RPP1/RPP2